MIWHLLTGEYPPARGGIGDYTRLLARALVTSGREVHVWAPGGETEDTFPVHDIGGYGPSALRRLGARLDAHPRPRRLLVQYAPQAFGLRGMNVPFATWLLGRRLAGDDVRVMFHEPFVPFRAGRLRHDVLAATNRLMAILLLRASTRAYVSTEAWIPLLQPFAPAALQFRTLPIPSTIPRIDDPAAVHRLGARLTSGGDRPLVAHFGTYGGLIAPQLAKSISTLRANRPDALVILLGGGAESFAAALRSRDGGTGEGVVAVGYLPPEAVSLHLQAADLAIQPYPDGADTRRTTLMACLANGIPTVTTRGRFTSPDIAGAPIELVDTSAPDAVGAAAAARLSRAPVTDTEREAIRRYYAGHFSIENTVAALVADEECP